MNRFPPRDQIIRKGRQLQYLTIVWNSLECLIALSAGFLAGSIALVGFGFDSAIEVSSGLAALWRLHYDHESMRERAERHSLRVIGACFLLLAGYVSYETVQSLVQGKAPEHSVVGICLAILSLVVMPWLARQKRTIATAMESGALEADTRQTEICVYLSAILLVGLGLNTWLGWWWADPIAGLAMVPLIAWEGKEALQGHTCCPD